MPLSTDSLVMPSNAPAGIGFPAFPVGSAAIAASAFLELATYVPNEDTYYDAAVKILKSLSSPAYRAVPGTNNNFILMHSVGSIPHGQEIDVP